MDPIYQPHFNLVALQRQLHKKLQEDIEALTQGLNALQLRSKIALLETREWREG